MRKSLYTVALFLAAAVFLAAYRWQPQKTVYTGTFGDASTDCDASTDATADLTCLNTGDISVTAWPQATVGWTYVRESGAAGTAVHVQCDERDSGSAQWYLGLTCPSGTCTNTDWIYTTSASTAGRIHFGVNADLLRCRGWVASGNSADTLRLVVRSASTVGD